MLAICEGRKDGGGLTGNIDIVLKRSDDGGKTWGPLEVVADDGDHTLGNPCPVVDRRDGTIFLPVSRSLGGDLETEIVAGESRDPTRVMLTESRDDGKTWTPLRDITASAKKESWTWYGPGPGTGIQLADGRLVVPAYHAGGDRVYRSHVIYSDDRGKTWQRSNSIGQHCGECYVVERRDGTLYLNARTNSKEPTERRTVAVSRDRGTTWTNARFDKQLYDSHCQGCTIALATNKDTAPLWLFSNPAGPGRQNLTVRVSRDEGRTWPIARRLRAGDSQYSSLAQLRDGSVGCLYDCWENGNYRLCFTRFSQAWLNASQPPK